MSEHDGFDYQTWVTGMGHLDFCVFHWFCTEEEHRV